jgi:hypothetical protein
MRKRPNRIWCHLSDAELLDFKRKVERTGMSRQAYLRSLINGYVPRELPPSDFFSMMKELHAIGNNVHQISARANATGFYMAKEFLEKMDELFAAIDRIEAAVLEPEKINGNNKNMGS